RGSEEAKTIGSPSGASPPLVSGVSSPVVAGAVVSALPSVVGVASPPAVVVEALSPPQAASTRASAATSAVHRSVLIRVSSRRCPPRFGLGSCGPGRTVCVNRFPWYAEIPPPKLTIDCGRAASCWHVRSEEHTSELQSRENLVCRLLLE